MTLLAFAVAVTLFGGAVGMAELVSRYRDAPTRAIASLPAGLYIALNAAASLAAFGLIQVFDFRFGVTGADAGAKLLWVQALVASFGAMAAFRSSLFTVRVGDQDVGVGPQGLLQIILDAADRGVDRERAAGRAAEVATAMKDLSFQRAYIALPTLCLELMQNLPQDQQAALGDEIRKLKDAPMDEATKALVLGLKLMNVVGHPVLSAAITSAGPKIRRAAALEPLSKPVELVVGERRQLLAQATDAAGAHLPAGVMNWAGGADDVAEITTEGLVTAVAPGSAYATAAVDGLIAQVEILVNARRAQGQILAMDTASSTPAAPAPLPVEPPRKAPAATG